LVGGLLTLLEQKEFKAADVIDLPDWRRKMLRRIDMGRSWELAKQSYDDVCEQRDAYKRELEFTTQQLAELRDALAKLRAAVLARHEADDALAKLYSERAIARARAVERDPNAALN